MDNIQVASKSKSTEIEATHSGRYASISADKLRGGYYTPSDLAEWMCSWAIRDRKETILEPSCGDGAFLDATNTHLTILGAKRPPRANQMLGIEVSPEEAKKARSRLKVDLGDQANDVVITSDFFAWWGKKNRPQFDVVIGNPPFIRYQSFPEPYRSRAMHIMKSEGLTPNRLTNSWVPFVVAATATLNVGGRMALILPAELLQVSYAAQLRSFLNNRFGCINLVTCNELFFKNAEQEVLILLADEARNFPSSNNSCKVKLTEGRSISDIIKKPPNRLLKGSSPKTICHDNEKWLKYFLNSKEITFMRALRTGETSTNLGNYASINVGVVTGKNQFFVLRQSDVKRLKLDSYTIPLIARSAHLEGTKVDKTDWRTLVNDDQRVNLLHLEPINNSKPKGALANYIHFGESQNVHKGYKCSIRSPWYTVPSVYEPDAFVFRQIYNFPRIVLNKAGATATDTIHRMRCKNDEPSKVIANSYTYLTAASAEIEGRSYGGGILELEPTEAENLLMPAVLGDAVPIEESDSLIREGRLDVVLEENNRIILKDKMGLSNNECKMLRDIWEKMRDRRLTRRRSERMARR